MNLLRRLWKKVTGPRVPDQSRVTVMAVAGHLLLEHSGDRIGVYIDMENPVRVLPGTSRAAEIGAAILTEAALARMASNGSPSQPPEQTAYAARLRQAIGLAPKAALWSGMRLVHVWFTCDGLRVEPMRNLGRGAFEGRCLETPLRITGAVSPAELGGLVLQALDRCDGA